MSQDYLPPFTLTGSIVALVADISEAVGRFSVLADRASSLRLRRINRIRTIQGSLAIEGNSLSEEQISAIFDGKRIIAPPREIQEVRNAIKVYDQMWEWQPSNMEHLLEAHKILMNGLIDTQGQYRSGGVGVMKGDAIVHIAPPADRVPFLMADLLTWLQTTEQHPLIAAAVFHYEFEFIHPFADGNGRMGRLWQTLILGAWNPFLANLPVETLVHEHQDEYYTAINRSTATANSAGFIEFMLRMILDALNASVTPAVNPPVTPEVGKLLKIIQGEMTRRELQRKLDLKDEKHFRTHYLRPALDTGLIERTISAKPNSRLQKYRLTAAGRAYHFRKNRKP